MIATLELPLEMRLKGITYNVLLYSAFNHVNSGKLLSEFIQNMKTEFNASDDLCNNVEKQINSYEIDNNRI